MMQQRKMRRLMRLKQQQRLLEVRGSPQQQTKLELTQLER